MAKASAVQARIMKELANIRQVLEIMNGATLEEMIEAENVKAQKAAAAAEKRAAASAKKTGSG